jgi:hypothetical protein
MTAQVKATLAMVGCLLWALFFAWIGFHCPRVMMIFLAGVLSVSVMVISWWFFVLWFEK